MKEKTVYEIKETLCRYIDDMAGKDLTPTTLDQLHKLTDTLKNMLKIEMLEEVSDDYGESERGYSDRRDRSYGYSGVRDSSNYSGERRGHYVSGHYSRAARYDDDMPEYGRSRYSGYVEAKGDIVQQMHEIAAQASPKDREAIMRCITQMQNA